MLDDEKAILNELQQNYQHAAAETVYEDVLLHPEKISWGLF
jgi:hypothetical protein